MSSEHLPLDRSCKSHGLVFQLLHAHFLRSLYIIFKMRATAFAIGSLVAASQVLASVAPRQPYAYPTKPEFKRGDQSCTPTDKITPKILIISMVSNAVSTDNDLLSHK